VTELAGKLELVPTPYWDAADYAVKKGWDLAFTRYIMAQGKAAKGHTRRAEMPVLDEVDLQGLRAALAEHGHRIDATARKMVRDLQPIQAQIYADKSIDGTMSHGIESTRQFLQGAHLFVSKELHILDGHHRWLSGMLIEPSLEVPLFVVDEEEMDALRDTLAYSDAAGHGRNA
jgi:hypothetical protein